MQESKAYQLAAIAVMNSNLADQDKIDVLRVLFDKEEVALYVESKEEQETENVLQNG